MPLIENSSRELFNLLPFIFFFQLNFKNKQKTEDSNKVFNSVQESITETTKLTKKRPISKSSTAKKPLPDMDEAAKQFAQL
uniref:Uncharacterized protein n=1 Tax=Magallana gigas TaxID=29159 RepID=A0A8W8K9E4_MAGGI